MLMTLGSNIMALKAEFKDAPEIFTGSLLHSLANSALNFDNGANHAVYNHAFS